MKPSRAFLAARTAWAVPLGVSWTAISTWISWLVLPLVRRGPERVLVVRVGDEDDPAHARFDGRLEDVDEDRDAERRVKHLRQSGQHPLALAGG